MKVLQKLPVIHFDFKSDVYQLALHAIICENMCSDLDAGSFTS